MAQRVEYRVLPNTPDAILLDRIVTVLAHIDRERPKFKTFRAWCRELNIWKKEETPIALGFVGVRGLDGRGKITLAPIARKLLDAPDPPARQVVLFQYMLAKNLLLTKYVIEALDTESGGRLHSTHELHRYLSSYAYPGDSVGLVNFQHWIKWFQAAAGVKIIGIRWALGEQSEAALPKIRALDTEEILEDEALAGEEEEEEEEDDDGGDAEADRPAAAPAEPAGAVPKAPPAVEAAGESSPEDEEDLPDMPPDAGPPAIDEEATARFAAQLGIDEEDLAEPPAAAPAIAARHGAFVRPERTASPVAAPVVRPPRHPTHAGGISPQERLETVAQVKAWWASFPHKRRLFAANLGFAAESYERAPKRFLLRLMTAAILVDHEHLEAPIGGFLQKLDELDAFARIGRPGDGDGDGLDRVLADAEFFQGNPWFQRLAENLVHTAHFQARLATADDTLEAIQQSRSAAQVAERVSLDLFGGGFALPPFWLIREMVALGLWTKPSFAAVACVPTYRTRLSAFRLGLTDSFYAEGFPELLRMSQVLSRFFDESCDFNAPLDQLADGFGCQLRCPHVLACPLSCREKTSI